MEKRIMGEMLLCYRNHLEEEEKSRNTIEKYLRDVQAFKKFMGERPVSRQELTAYKESLRDRYAVQSINSMLSSIHSFLRLLRLGRLLCPSDTGTETGVLRPGKGAVQGRVCASRGDSQASEKGEAGGGASDNLRYGDSGQRAAFCDSGGGKQREHRGILQGKIPADFLSPKTSARFETIY